MHSVNKHLSTSCVHCCCTISIALVFCQHLPTGHCGTVPESNRCPSSANAGILCGRPFHRHLAEGRSGRSGWGRTLDRCRFDATSLPLPPLPLSRSLHKTSTSLKVKSEFNLSEIWRRNLERKYAEEPNGLENIMISWESSLKAIHSPLTAGSCKTSATTPVQGLGNL